MEANRRFGFISRLFGARGPAPVPASRSDAAQPSNPAAGLTPTELEQAYRNLLMENLVLVESNRRLHERLARQEGGLEDSPATRQLLQTQRNALAERSHRLRELEYENKQLTRNYKKLSEQHQRLLGQGGGRDEVARLRRELEGCKAELAEARTALHEKSSDLLQLTDRYYQLEARLKPKLPTTQAANSHF
jgi:predicted  nucleic acid-binding Zn-ribbon protein